jgi:prevent-host-death family protein
MKKLLPPDIDIRNGIVPITKAAASLAEVVKRVKEQRQPCLITQNGYPAVVMIDVDSYAELRELAEQAITQSDFQDDPGRERSDESKLQR